MERIIKEEWKYESREEDIKNLTIAIREDINIDAGYLFDENIKAAYIQYQDSLSVVEYYLSLLILEMEK